MAGQAYERLSVEDFGRKLLLTGDLDPLYLALRRVEFDQRQMKRWLLAYWCLYHAGVSCLISELEGAEFFDALLEAADNTTPVPGVGGRWPRGSERRHWRGAQALASASDLADRTDAVPEHLVDELMPMVGAARERFSAVAGRVRKWRGFGPWIGFKVCDMLERVLDYPVDFTEADIFMFDDPVKGANLVHNMLRERGDLLPEEKETNQAGRIKVAVSYLGKHFHNFTAPPTFDRPLNLQEIETILCKWKSHLNGHYPVNNDIHEIREGLTAWAPHVKSASRLLNAMPTGQVLREYEDLAQKGITI